MITLPYLILGAILVGLALPPALAERSWKRFAVALGLSAIGVVLPLVVFGFSAFLVSEWKGGCRCGWLDCFHVGKLALSPLVLAATAALYAREVLRTDRAKPWIARGIALGALVSLVCLVLGCIAPGGEKGLGLGLLVPLYVAVWC